MTRRNAPAPRLIRWAAVVAVLLIISMCAGVAEGAPSKSKRATSREAQLITQIAGVDQNIADLDNSVAVRQEQVNKALVDYQNAVAAQQLADTAAKGARRELRLSTDAVEKAQEDFNEFIRTVQRQGNQRGSMADYVSSHDPDAVLNKMTAVDQIGRNQKAIINRLQVARNQRANRLAAAQATKRQASFATAGAAARKDDAITSVTQVRRQLADEQQRRGLLVQQRTGIQKQLAEIRKATTKKVDLDTPTTSSGTGSVGGTGSSAGDIVGNLLGTDNPSMKMAADAAAKLLLDTGQQLLASLVGQQQLPRSALLDELGLGGADLGSSGPNSLATRLTTGSAGSLFGSTGSSGGGVIRPGLRGPQAVEVIVNRALSQLNVPYAWGGGDANGPTQGIRDGGVADSYGDYNKIGFDCSGLMIYAFAGVGIELPHYTGYQYTSGPQVPLSQIKRGDMIFYGPNASQHVALYLGDGKMVEAPQSGSIVKVSPLRTDGAMPMVVRLL
ncbi:cell wall-associated NlpC family hydrolase [Gordonia amarae]|nr:cell wall-associated NlpC family hydrolase [Gordonia amarae]GAB03687.1 putative Rpf-interacting protein [Gordonia amarae NBRC 15530]